MSLVILGGPKTGKTTFAKETGKRFVSTDDYISLGWSEASQECARILVEEKPEIMEGVAAARVLRKALEMTTEKPCEKVLILSHHWQPQTSHQKAMEKGIFTVLQKIEPELMKRGVEIRWKE